MLKEKSGFTLIELLVVISIIAILSALTLPAILKARQQASINKVMAEMTSFASTDASIYIDLKSRGYVRLVDSVLPKSTSIILGPPSNPLKIDTAATGYATTNFIAVTDFPNDTEFQNCWDGPYAVHQPKSTFNPLSAPPVGEYPNAGGVVLPPSATPTVWSNDKFPTGTPLDAWGHPYGMAWNIIEQVMVIYSAGPDGNFQTAPGDITVAIGSDDLLYKFR